MTWKWDIFRSGIQNTFSLNPFDKAHTNHSSVHSLYMFKDDFRGVLSVFGGELLGVFGIAP